MTPTPSSPSCSKAKIDPMKVIKSGLVHEYANYDSSSHCEAHIACVEALAPIDGERIRAIANNYLRTYGRIRNHRELQRECSIALDKIAPTGLYFGAPSVNSNMSAFGRNGLHAGRPMPDCRSAQLRSSIAHSIRLLLLIFCGSYAKQALTPSPVRSPEKITRTGSPTRSRHPRQ